MILRIAIPTPLWQSFDYLPCDQDVDRHYESGIRIKVPFGYRELVGILLAVTQHSEVPPDKLKKIIEIVDEQPLISKPLLQLYQWASDYYHFPIGEVILGTIPKKLREGHLNPCNALDASSEKRWPKKIENKHLQLNEQQQEALLSITEHSNFNTYLLHGVTGSGKTEVYLQSLAALLNAKKQALVLVPEIALTPQTVRRFQERFNVPVVQLHSELTDKQRMTAWMQAYHGEAGIVIGTRSAIFVPLKNPGMIIVDEEHDTSFKQQSGFRYNARDLAVMRGRIENIPVVLGSATPSLESLHNVSKRRYHYLRLEQRAGEANAPDTRLIDLCDKKLHAGLSEALLALIKQHIEAQGQVLLFLNRRGYAPILMCHHCGWMVSCDRCDAKMTLHHRPKQLHCHHCDKTRKPPRICQKCEQSELIPIGLGTEQLETTLSQFFPDQTILRIDRDSVSGRGQMQKLLDEIHNEQANILIGTQMLAKGHHFSKLSLVAVVDADSGLFSTDFRAVERMAQLLLQVSGRAGREAKRGEVVIQTHHPDNPLLQLLLTQGYSAFAKAVLKERNNAALPPWTHLALLRAESSSRDTAKRFLLQIKNDLQKQTDESIEMIGPLPATMERKAGRYRLQLLLQAPQRPILQDTLKLLMKQLSEIKRKKTLRWSLDVDPIEM